jgi:hypothetical protein
MSKVTAIINGFKRPQNVDHIIMSLLCQSVRVDDILVWWNDPCCAQQSRYTKHVKSIISSYNFGVWARFSLALNTSSDHIVIFDDDTIPGSRWIENCLNHEQLGLLGTIGLIYKNRVRYMDHVRYGWANPNEDPIHVDIVGHSWFFRREWLPFYFRELRPQVGFELFGEDIHFSYILQKYCNIPTYVPPHPSNNMSLWGSLYGGLGTDSHAISMTPDAFSKWDIPFQYYLGKGFRLIHER